LMRVYGTEVWGKTLGLIGVDRIISDHDATRTGLSCFSISKFIGSSRLESPRYASSMFADKDCMKAVELKVGWMPFMTSGSPHWCLALGLSLCATASRHTSYIKPLNIKFISLSFLAIRLELSFEGQDCKNLSTNGITSLKHFSRQ